MKKIILTFGLILLSFAVFAQQAGKQRVFDQAHLFSESQISTLEDSLAEFLDKYNKEAVIVTTSDAQGKSAEAYADDFYDENDFGTGSGKDGVLFLIDMDNRKIHVSTSGSMIDYLEDWRIEKIYDDVSPYMADGSYYSAAVVFIKSTANFVDQGIPEDHQRIDRETGKAYTPDEARNAGIIACIASLLSCLGITKSYKFKRNYYRYSPQDNGTLELETNEDTFVNKYTTQRRIETASSSGGSHPHVSTTHTSSSGRTHGGNSSRSF